MILEWLGLERFEELDGELGLGFIAIELEPRASWQMNTKGRRGIAPGGRCRHGIVDDDLRKRRQAIGWPFLLAPFEGPTREGRILDAMPLGKSGPAQAAALELVEKGLAALAPYANALAAVDLEDLGVR